MRRTIAIPLVLLALAVLSTALVASAQTDPPALGDGDWVIGDDTVIDDWGIIRLRGSITIQSGGSLTLSNTDLMFRNAVSGEDGISVLGGGSLLIVNGSTVGSDRPGFAWTCEMEAGSTLRILDSSIEECGLPSFGIRPQWRRLGLYVATADARIENSTFFGGLVGLYFEQGVIARPVRNCTFENMYGIVSFGMTIEDCTFRDQTIFGVLFHGGTEGRISRCRFENVFSTCLQVGMEYFEPYELFTASAVIEDSSFVRSTRGIRVLDSCTASISDCSVDGMEQEGLVLRPLANVQLENGWFINSSRAIVAVDTSELNWTVSMPSLVRNGNVTLTGDLIITDGARLDLLAIRNLTMLSHVSDPLRIDIGDEATLKVVNSSLDIPPNDAAPTRWAPIRLTGPQGTLELEGVRSLDLRYPVELGVLSARGCTLPLGEWSVGRALLYDSTLVPDPGGHRASLTLDATGPILGSDIHRCAIDGIEFTPGADPPVLVVDRAIVKTVDFISDLPSQMSDGFVDVQGARDESRLDAYWSVRAHVHWQNQLPVAGVDVAVNSTGLEAFTLSTDTHGYTRTEWLLTEQAWEDGTVSWMPVLFTVNVTGLMGSEVVHWVSEPITVNILVFDLVLPRLVIDQGRNLATNESELMLSGSAFDEHSGVAFLEAAVLPQDYIRVPLLDGNGRFETVFELKEGHQTISFRVYDSVGNRRRVAVDVYFSTKSPYLFVDEPGDGAWVNTVMTFLVGTTEPNSTVEAGGRLQVAHDGTFRILVYLEEGPNLVTVNVTSPAGNHNTTLLTLYLDTEEPALVIISPPEPGHSTRLSRVLVRGRTEEGSQAFINGVPIDMLAGGYFQSNVSLDEGAKKVVVTSVDRAGNEALRELVFTLDSTPPELTVVLEGRDSSFYAGESVLRTSAETVTLLVVTEPNVTLEVNGEEVDLTGGSISLDHGLEEGLQTILVRATDPAGNYAEVGPIAIEVDRSPPTLSLHAGTPTATEEALLSLMGRTEANVTLTVNGAYIPVDREGWFVRNFLLSEGLNRLELVAEDEFGQTTTLVHEVEMSPSKPSPTPPPSSRVPFMLGLTLLVLLVEAIALELWWWRRRATA